MCFVFINIQAHVPIAPEAIHILQLPFDNDETLMKLGKLFY